MQDGRICLGLKGEGNGNPLQCSCLENPRDGGAWWAAIYGVGSHRVGHDWSDLTATKHKGKLSLTKKWKIPQRPWIGLWCNNPGGCTMLSHWKWEVSNFLKGTVWEMWVKFYWGQNENYSVWNSAEKMLQRVKEGRRKNICDFGEGSYAPPSTHFTKDSREPRRLLLWGADVSISNFSAFLDVRRCWKLGS